VSLKAGMRLRAQNSSCEVIVVRGADSVGSLSCAGQEMLPDATPAAGAADGPKVELGKRYVDEDDSVEVLCVKAGIGPLAADGRELGIKSAKPLPSSD
jgi:hypothetical protein